MATTTVIRGGTVVDGTGAPRRRADVSIEGGRIAEIGDHLHGDVELDAAGHVVAPGFVDIHTHYDAQVFWDPALTPSCFHGVTTVVAGNCGFSIAPTHSGDRELIANTLQKVEDMNPASLMAGIPWDFETFPEYLRSVERRGTMINFSAYVGHTPVRMWVMGADAGERPATPEEIQRMSAVVAEAMEAGAAGFATSFAITHIGADGRPIPSRRAARDEIEALFRVVGAAGRGVVAVNGGDAMSFAEAYQLQPTIGAPFTYTALLTFGNGAHMRMVDIHRAGVAAGADVWPQVSCRPLTFSMLMTEPFVLNTNPVFAKLSSGGLEARRAAFADPVWRKEVRERWEAREGIPPRWEAFEILMSDANPQLVGRKLSELAAERGADPLDVLLDVTLEEPELALRVRSILANDDQEGIAGLLREEQCTLGLSDAGAHVGQLCDAPLPTDLLGNWVRERQVLTLEEAIHKLTQVQTQLFGFADRGVLAPGMAADVVVFDPDQVAPGPLRRVRDFPAGGERLTADEPSGMRHLLVNGQVVQRDGQLEPDVTDRRPGQLVRPAPRG
jgi:N-acyl-D-aspartate/D-glutamate deacylase